MDSRASVNAANTGSDQKMLKIIVRSVHTCSKAAKKQRFEIGENDSLFDLANAINSSRSFPDEDFVAPEGKFHFQYYDSDEEDWVGIPRLNETRYKAKDFVDKHLSVAPFEKPKSYYKRKPRNRKRNRPNNTETRTGGEPGRASRQPKREKQEEEQHESQAHRVKEESDDESVVFLRVEPCNPKTHK